MGKHGIIKFKVGLFGWTLGSLIPSIAPDLIAASWQNYVTLSLPDVHLGPAKHLPSEDASHKIMIPWFYIQEWKGWSMPSASHHLIPNSWLPARLLFHIAAYYWHSRNDKTKYWDKRKVNLHKILHCLKSPKMTRLEATFRQGTLVNLNDNLHGHLRALLLNGGEEHIALK